MSDDHDQRHPEAGATETEGDDTFLYDDLLPLWRTANGETGSARQGKKSRRRNAAMSDAAPTDDDELLRLFPALRDVPVPEDERPDPFWQLWSKSGQEPEPPAPKRVKPVSTWPLPKVAGQELRNVLLLSIEDLNDWIEPLGGHPQALTPNLTKLAARSCVFFNAEAPAPACGPSRNATLFGQAPWRTGLYMNKHDWRDAFEDSSCSLVGIARAAGWDTIGTGKIFYKPIKDGLAWNETGEDFRDKELPPISRSVREGKLNRHFDFGPVPDSYRPLGDERNVDYLISTMTPDAARTMWGIGIVKPHPPFTCPREYWDMFKGPITPPPGLGQSVFDPDNERLLERLPKVAREDIIRRDIGRTLHDTGEYDDFVRAYLASIAYADAMAGRVLDHLEAIGLLNSTLIVLWSDHGWQLGEKLAFRKFSLWDRALRVPFFFSGPGIQPRVVNEPVSLLDLYPTVAGMMGLETPHQLDGADLGAVLTANRQPAGVAVSSWAVGRPGNPNVALTVRTPDFRLIRYWDGSMELYDSEIDPYEHFNLLHGEQPSGNLKSVVDDLMTLLPTDVATSVAAAARAQKGITVEACV